MSVSPAGPVTAARPTISYHTFMMNARIIRDSVQVKYVKNVQDPTANLFEGN